MSSGRAWLALPAFGALALVYLVAEIALAGRIGPPLDDGWIYMAFARSLAAGEGVTYPGHDGPVAAVTGPLWCALLAGAMLLLGQGVLASKALGLLVGFAAVLGVHRLARAVTGDATAAAVAAVLFALTPRQMWGDLSGMEVPLYVALVTFGLALHVERRDAPLARWLPAALCLWGAGWARPECFVFLAVAVLERRRLGAALLALGLVALYPLYHVAVSGHALPTTFYAKAASGAPWTIARVEGVGAALGTAATGAATQTAAFLGYLGGYVPFVVPAFLLGVLRVRRDRALRTVVTALVAFALARGVLGFSGPWFQHGRYFAHMWPLFLVVCLAGIDLGRTGHALAGVVLAVVGTAFLVDTDVALLLAFDRLGGDLELDLDAAARALVWVPAVLALGLALLGLAAYGRRGRIPRPPLWAVAPWLAAAIVLGAVRHGQGVRDTYALNVAMAEAVRAIVPEGELVACHDIGALGWFADRPLLDLAGLGSPDVVFRPRPAGRRWDVVAILAERRPRWLCLTDDMATMVNPAVTRPAGLAGAQLRHEIRFPENVTVQGDTYRLIELAWE